MEEEVKPTYIKSGNVGIFRERFFSIPDVIPIADEYMNKVFLLKDLEGLGYECSGEIVNGEVILKGEQSKVTQEDIDVTFVTPQYLHRRNSKRVYGEALGTNLMAYTPQSYSTEEAIAIEKVEMVEDEYTVTKKGYIAKPKPAVYFTKKSLEEALAQNDKYVNDAINSVRGE